MVYGTYAGVDYMYNLIFCLLQSRLKPIYHGQPYDRPESTLTLCQS
jgi:hypothetical protein